MEHVGSMPTLCHLVERILLSTGRPGTNSLQNPRDDGSQPVPAETWQTPLVTLTAKVPESGEEGDNLQLRWWLSVVARSLNETPRNGVIMRCIISWRERD